MRESGDDLEVSHGGSNEGFRCTLVYYPERGEGVVVMTNSDSGGAIGTEVLHALARYFGWPGYGTNNIARSRSLPRRRMHFERDATGRVTTLSPGGLKLTRRER